MADHPLVPTRLAVLASLRGARPGGVSGESLAHTLGVSRAAVAKHVDALRRRGYAIEAVPGRGYRLLASPDAPLPEEVAPLLEHAVWLSLQGGGATSSTNDDCKRLARAGAPEGTVVLASEQTGGRGRLGRGWVSPEGGAYFSLVLRPRLSPAQMPTMALAVSLGVCLGLERLGARAMLKWPNDVHLGGGKVAGVLVEASAETDRVEWAVAGCGLNVRRPVSPVAGAAYLEDVLGSSPGIARAAAACLDGVAETYERLASAGFAALLSEYSRRSVLEGRRVRVRDASGDTLAEGVAEGVDAEGRLLVRSGAAVVAMALGDVTLA